MTEAKKIGLVYAGECRVVIPAALAYSLKEGHKIVFYDLQSGKIDALPLVGCLFVQEADLPNWAGFDQIHRLNLTVKDGNADPDPEEGGE